MNNWRSYWQGYWAHQLCGFHQDRNEEFYKKKADELYRYLGQAKSVLDFGCGSADLLVYYAGNFQEVIGADYSESMLLEAEERLSTFDCSNVKLINADLENVWGKVSNRKYDVIYCSAVVQYFDKKQLEIFIRESVKLLEPNGKVVLFDVIHPLLFLLRETGFFRKEAYSLWLNIRHMMRFLVASLYRIMKGMPYTQYGYLYHPVELEKIAGDYGCKMESVWSAYYEYRYHAIIERCQQGDDA